MKIVLTFALLNYELLILREGQNVSPPEVQFSWFFQNWKLRLSLWVQLFFRSPSPIYYLSHCACPDDGSKMAAVIKSEKGTMMRGWRSSSLGASGLERKPVPRCLHELFKEHGIEFLAFLFGCSPGNLMNASQPEVLPARRLSYIIISTMSVSGLSSSVKKPP